MATKPFVVIDSEKERTLLESIAKGNPDAVGGLCELYGERIFRYCYRFLGNRNDAEDATAETFLRVLRRANQLRDDGSFRTWLFRIARNLCIDRLRQHKLVPFPEELESNTSEERTALRLTVQQALSDLPTEHREPLILCDLEDMPAREAALVLDISVPALKSRLYRGRRALRDKLSGIYGPYVEPQPTPTPSMNTRTLRPAPASRLSLSLSR